MIEGDILSLPKGELYKILVQVLSSGNKFRFRARGDSMMPLIRNGDLITISPVAFKNLKTGDVVAIAIAAESRVIIHRISRIVPEGLYTRGDNMLREDCFSPSTEVYGKVVIVQQNGRIKAFGNMAFFGMRVVRFFRIRFSQLLSRQGKR